MSGYAFYLGYKSHVLVDCIFGLPLYELTTQATIMDSTVAVDILAAANQILPLQGCSFLADKGYDAKSIYNTVKSVYDEEAFIPLNPRGTKASKTLPRYGFCALETPQALLIPIYRVCGLLLLPVLLISYFFAK